MVALGREDTVSHAGKYILQQPICLKGLSNEGWKKKEEELGKREEWKKEYEKGWRKREEELKKEWRKREEELTKESRKREEELKKEYEKKWRKKEEELKKENEKKWRKKEEELKKEYEKKSRKREKEWKKENKKKEEECSTGSMGFIAPSFSGGTPSPYRGSPFMVSKWLHDLDWTDDEDAEVMKMMKMDDLVF